MINYIHSNYHNITNNSIISHSTWEKLTISIKNKDKYNENKSISLFYDISNEYNIDIKNIIKDYLNYIIHNKPEYLSSSFLKFTEFVIHLVNPNNIQIINYIVFKLNYFFNLINL